MDICDNYRPIALQSNISKILEKFVCIRLVNHLELNKIIHPHQFGFQRSKNTQHNLISLTNYISNALNDGEYCIGVFLDLKKAFDTVDHDILLRKLKHYGVDNIELQWFKCYLSDRTQVVDINGHFSEPENIDISVLQGSILGPILFDIFVNDLPDISLLMTYLFADDTQGLLRHKSLPTLMDNVNMELVKWSSWFRANKLGVNVDKTKYIIFHTKGKKIDMAGKNIVFNNNDPTLPFNPDLVTNLERIHTVHENPNMRSYKLLGIFLDENLTLNLHIPVLLAKLAKANFMLSRSKNILPQKALLSIYYAYFHSHLLYCPIIISMTSLANVNKIFIMQKKAIRIVMQASYNAHTAPMFDKLRLLTYHKIIQQAKLHFMHSYHYSYAPLAFSNTWSKNSDRNLPVNLRNLNDYVIPRPNYEFFKRMPFYSLPLIWKNAGFF